MSDELRHLEAAYALDALDPDERREFEARYSASEISARDVRDFRETAAVLAEAVSLIFVNTLMAKTNMLILQWMCAVRNPRFTLVCDPQNPTGKLYPM